MATACVKFNELGGTALTFECIECLGSCPLKQQYSSADCVATMQTHICVFLTPLSSPVIQLCEHCASDSSCI